ncbi:hypothetical protein D3C86_2020740 [compost metagenome]
MLVQLFPSVTEYETIVVPADCPVNAPVLLIVAFELLTDHTPPLVVFVRLIVELIQTEDKPTIVFTAGSAFIVTVVLVRFVQLFPSVIL